MYKSVYEWLVESKKQKSIGIKPRLFLTQIDVSIPNVTPYTHEKQFE